MTDTVEPVEAPEETPKVLIPIPVLEKKPARNPPKFYVLDDTLVAQTDSEPLCLALKVPMRWLPELDEISTYFEQLEFILQRRGDEETLERLYDMDIIDAREIARKFSQATSEKEQARLGESYRSSDS